MTGLNEDLHNAATSAYDDGLGRIKTVILAGGEGTRLRPYTSVLPKPLMPLGDRAILEIVVRQLAREGVTDITLSVGHLAHLIQAVFGNGGSHGADIKYVREDIPLGTAGSIRLVPGLDSTFLVLNGDLVTTLNYRELLRSHRENENMLTIATTKRQVRIDYGVVEPGFGPMQRIIGFEEKPVFERMVSMGVYVMEPQVLDFIPGDTRFDFPELVHKLLAAGAPTGVFIHDGLWLDIGRHEDYEQAIALWEQGELDSLQDDGEPTTTSTDDRRPSLVTTLSEV